jgi:hypothetical protein
LSFDLGPAFREAAGDGQLFNSEQLEPQEFYNCTWEALRQTARAFGFTGYDDAELRAEANRILGRGDYNYGERWETNLAVAEALWPALSGRMSIEYPNDVIAAIKAHGEAGRRVHCGFWCDSAAWVPPKSAITYSHALMSLAGDGGGVWWVNPEPHPDIYLSDNTMRNLYDGGGILVFEPAPIPANQEDAMPEQVVIASGVGSKTKPIDAIVGNGSLDEIHFILANVKDVGNVQPPPKVKTRVSWVDLTGNVLGAQDLEATFASMGIAQAPDGAWRVNATPLGPNGIWSVTRTKKGGK